MAISTPALPLSKPVSAIPVTWAAHAGSRRRRINPEAGHALEILGHAIDYLTDEYVHRGGTFHPQDPELHAVQMLMAVNRAIYFDCPQVPTLGERCKKLLGIGQN